MNVPVISPEDTLLQEAGARGGVIVGVSGQDDRRYLQGHQFLGFSPGDGVPIEQRVYLCNRAYIPSYFSSIWTAISVQFPSLEGDY